MTNDAKKIIAIGGIVCRESKRAKPVEE